MIAIIDSGSTKADWRVIHPNGAQYSFGTSGYNPFILSIDDIQQGLQSELDENLETDKFTDIFFYGAGCSDHYRCSLVQEAFIRVFKSANVVVDHDIIACARACLGHQPGIACILGTGSNSCLYDGEKITDHITNLGYLVGDEGSGGHLGKKLLRAYFYRELPSDIKVAFEARFPEGEREILNRIYNKDKPNVYLASFARFISDHKDHFYIQNMVSQAFDKFIKRHVCKYEGHTSLPIGIVGSVAFHFKNILKICLEERGMNMGVVLKKPIDNLVNYHLQGKEFVPVEG